MNEPRRLREASDSPFERALLDAGADYRSSDDAKARTLAALGLAGSALVSVSAASAASSTLAGKLGWGKLIAIVSTLGAIGAVPVGYWVLDRDAEPLKPPVVAQLAKPSPVVATAPSPAPEVEAAPAGEPVALRELPVAPPVAAVAPPRRTEAKPAAANGGAALTAELGALDAARSALGKGEPRRALSLLDGYAKSYPRGRLMLEAEVLRIDALARAGDTQAAKQRAAAFLRRHPTSVLAARVRGYTDG